MQNCHLYINSVCISFKQTEPRHKRRSTFRRLDNIQELPACIAKLDYNLEAVGVTRSSDELSYVPISCDFSETNSCLIHAFGTITSYLRRTHDDDIASGNSIIWQWLHGEDLLDGYSEEESDEDANDDYDCIYNSYTYSAIPHPSFSKCGNFITAISNSGQKGVQLVGFSSPSLSSDTHIVDDVCPVTLKTSGRGNISGRMKVICIDDEYAVTVTDVQYSQQFGSYEMIVWRVLYIEEQLALKYVWSKRLSSIIITPDFPFGVSLISCNFSPDGQHVSFLLSNLTFFIVDIQTKSCGHIQDLCQLIGATDVFIESSNIVHYPLFRFSSLGVCP